MNILLVTSPIVDLSEPFRGGTEAFVVNLANALVNRGHSVDVLCKQADETNLFNTISLSESAIRMCDALTSESEGQKQYQAAQFGLIDTQNYNAVHYHSYYHAMYDYACMHERKNIVTLHTPVTPRLSLVHSLNSQRSDDVYIAVSQRLKSQWCEVVGDGISVIPNGVDTARFSSATCAIAQDYLLWSGRMCHEKGAHEAIVIARALQRPLVLAGQITDRSYFDTFIAPHLNDTVRYAGHLNYSGLIPLFQGADALLATSLWDEPFGLTTLEALACGTPVIGFNSAIPDELRHEHCVFIVSADEPGEWASALEHSARVKPSTCTAFAAQFSFEHTVDAYEALYASLPR